MCTPFSVSSGCDETLLQGMYAGPSRPSISEIHHSAPIGNPSHVESCWAHAWANPKPWDACAALTWLSLAARITICSMFWQEHCCSCKHVCAMLRLDLVARDLAEILVFSAAFDAERRTKPKQEHPRTVDSLSEPRPRRATAGRAGERHAAL